MNELVLEGRTKGLFQGPDQFTLDAIGGRSRAGRLNMLLAGLNVNKESAQLGFLLHSLLSTDNANDRRFTFFANSSMEALSGSIKLARHTALEAGRAGGWILCCDEHDAVGSHFDPLGRGLELALVPHVVVCASRAEALDVLQQRDFVGVIDIDGRPHRGKNELLTAARIRNAMTIAFDPSLDLTCGHLFTPDPNVDVNVYGESLTNRILPFGSFTMTREAYSVWNNVNESALHTSTFGGNALTLGVAIEQLRRHGYIDADAEAIISEIESERDAQLRYFRRHVNPYMAAGMDAFGLVLDIDNATHSSLALRGGRVVFDLAGGTGASLRGHNPPGIRECVLQNHIPDHDYLDDLEQRLNLLTGLPNLLPAVSGATAADIGLSIALAANDHRTIVLTFRGNYSGKTLPSFILSKYGPQPLKVDPESFGPYYPDVEYLDAFADDAEETLRRRLLKGDVAVVWLELIQGMQCKAIPARILATIDECKSEGGYVVAVDEVLTGAWRTSDSFLYSQSSLPCVDIATLAKPLSDMTTPIGVVLVGDSTFELATQNHPVLVQRLRTYYANQMSAHVAAAALAEVGDSPGIQGIADSRRALRSGLDAIVDRSSVFQSVQGTGGLLRLELNRRWFPFGDSSTLGRMIEMTISAEVLKQCDVLVAALRFFPALAIEERSLEDALERMTAYFEKTTPIMLYRRTLSYIGQLVISRIRAVIRRWAR